MATFRPVSCITANSASKAILRAAVDQAYREINEPRAFFYWPSYEIVMDAFADRWEPDRRHIKAPILDFVMTLFEYAWCTGPHSDERLLQAWIAATSPPASPPPPAPRKSLSNRIRREGMRLIRQISAVRETVGANGRSGGTPGAR